jgi:hypothetical protein
LSLSLSANLFLQPLPGVISGKFVIDVDGNIHQIPKQNIEIILKDTDQPINYRHHFQIRD